MGKFDLNRHAWIATISVAALVIFLMAGSSYLQQRSDLVTLRDEKLRAWNDAQATMRKEIELRRFMAGAGAPMTFDSAVIENQLLHLVRDWDDQTGVTNPSFQRVSQSAEHGFTRAFVDCLADAPGQGTDRGMGEKSFFARDRKLVTPQFLIRQYIFECHR